MSARLASLAAAAALAAACTHAKPSVLPDDLPDGAVRGRGVVHTVQKGQTLWRIARVYDVALQDLAEVNDVEAPAKIAVGQTLWIPGAEKPLEVPPAPLPLPPRAGARTASATAADKVRLPPAPLPPGEGPPRAAAGEPVRVAAAEAPDEPEPKVRTRHGRFVWPVQGVVFSRFGVRSGVQHDGIDIAAPEGTPVLAADAGEVLFAGEQRGYGNLVLLRHEDGLITVYAHNAANLVRAGARVRRGETLAKVGRTGRTTGPHLHFEVREDRLPRNPLFYLP